MKVLKQGRSRCLGGIIIDCRHKRLLLEGKMHGRGEKEGQELIMMMILMMIMMIVMMMMIMMVLVMVLGVVVMRHRRLFEDCGKL